MNPMFNEYKDAGKIQEALLIGRNMVNKAPGDSECVNAYLDFLLMLAEKLPRTDERKSFADQANLVLSFYEENADLTDDIINDIHVYHNRLGAVVTDIAQLEQEEYEKQKRAIEATNTTQIKKLYTIKQKLENAKTHAEFDKLLQEISAVDAEIDHDNLTSEQKTHYDQLNKSCTDVMHSISPPTNFCMASRVLSSSISFGSSIGRSARTLIFSSFTVCLQIKIGQSTRTVLQK